MQKEKKNERNGKRLIVRDYTEISGANEHSDLETLTHELSKAVQIGGCRKDMDLHMKMRPNKDSNEQSVQEFAARALRITSIENLTSWVWDDMNDKRCH
jgi:hypothetical protein